MHGACRHHIPTKYELLLLLVYFFTYFTLLPRTYMYVHANTKAPGCSGLVQSRLLTGCLQYVHMAGDRDG